MPTNTLAADAMASGAEQRVKLQNIAAKKRMQMGSTPMWLANSTRAEKKIMDGSTFSANPPWRGAITVSAPAA
eukprot:COSAG01_NODE_16035_length_1276_cov_1.186916_1_plen_72_part_10